MNILKLHLLSSTYTPRKLTQPILPLLLTWQFTSNNDFESHSRFKTFSSRIASFPTTNLSLTPKSLILRVSRTEPLMFLNGDIDADDGDDFTKYVDLSPNGVVYRNTLRLVECAMFAAVSGLAYFLSNSLAIENYFGCFFALPIVISSMRWGVGAGKKTMVATAMLLLVLSGPLKALTYLLMHGVVGFTMGSLWRMGTNWSLSIFICTIVRAMGAMGYVVISSFLIRENILALININIHASLTYMFTAIGINSIPSMNAIYAVFGTVLLLNCGFFVFLLHILYGIFLSRLGMNTSLKLPRWLLKAL